MNVLGVHTGQQTQINLQFSMTADAVWIIARSHAAQVHGRYVYGEGVVLGACRQLLAQGNQLAHDPVHGIQCVCTELGRRSVLMHPQV